MVIGGKEEAPGIRVEKMIEHDFTEVDDPGEPGAVPARLQELQQPPRQEGVIIEISGEAGLALGADGQQTFVSPAVLAKERHRTRS